jgi:hypothetical protein
MEGTQWRVDSNHNSIMAVGNGGAKPVTAGITLFYDQGTKQYNMEKQIDPDSQVWVNFADLIQNRIPDRDGNVFPEDTKSGTYSIQVISHPLQAVLYEGKVITDKTYGHATYGCIICCGYNPTGFDPDSAWTGLEATTGVNAMGTNTCTNISQAINDFYGTWWPSNASIFTMSTGTMTGVSIGTGKTNASATTVPVGGQGNDRPPYCPQRPSVNQGTGNVAPTITSISPSQGLVGAATNVTITGTAFASGATVNAGANISVSSVSVTSSTQMTATFTPTNSSSAGGNQGITVIVGGQNSNSVNFYAQTPSKLSISNITSLVVITDGNVLDYFGNILRTNRCGEYRNVASNLLDQQGGTILGGNFTLTESFSNYSTTLVPNPGPPPTQSSTQNTAQQILADTQFFGFVAPACPGSNDHEAFYQSFQITIGSVTFPLTTIYSIQRGEYSGTPTVSVTVNTP